ncbi:MAG TPA: alpha/beta hydrolase [Oceanospirillaceae bacterium]|nr:alpha/beta hydrolase [Oceanospirillaceae bacterium]
MSQDNHQLISINADAGLVLQVHLWPAENPTGWVHIMHGMSEHGGRYGHLALALNAAGFHVSADDHRGHGLTGQAANSLGHLANHDGWNKMAAEQIQIISHLQQQWSQPLTILGHSMGSFLATRVVQLYARKLKPSLRGLALSGSNYGAPWLFRIASVIASFERWRQGPLAQSKLLDQLSFGSFNNGFKPVRTPKDWICSDPAVVDAYIADPLAGHGISNQFWFDFLHGLADLSEPEDMAKIDADLPIYLFAGDQDPVGKQGKGVVALQKALQRAGSKEVGCVLYPNGRHEMINEPNREQVIADLLAWLGQRS